MGFTMHTQGDMTFLTVPLFDKYKAFLKHCFTTRGGGVSFKRCELNLGMNCEDDRENVVANYKLISEILAIDYKRIVLSMQTHSDIVRSITERDAGNGITTEQGYADMDGMITNIAKLPLAAVYADCVPLMFFDPTNMVIAMAHSGWKGTVQKIGVSTINKMIKEYNCRPQNILAAIGPSIGPCCFQADSDVMERFTQSFGEQAKMLIAKIDSNKYFIDLWAANHLILIDCGILDKNISTSGDCTSCKNELYFSYRAENGRTGRMAAIMMLV